MRNLFSTCQLVLLIVVAILIMREVRSPHPAEGAAASQVCVRIPFSPIT